MVQFSSHENFEIKDAYVVLKEAKNSTSEEFVFEKFYNCDYQKLE